MTTQPQYTADDAPSFGDETAYHWIMTIASGNGQSFRGGVLPASAVTTRAETFMKLVHDVKQSMGLAEDDPYAVLFFDIQPNRLPAPAARL